MKLLTTTALLALTTAAHAGGLSDPIIPYEPAPTPSESRLSVYGGLGYGEAALDNTFGLTYKDDTESVDFDLDGETYSGFGGVRYTFESGIVIGGEIQYTEITAQETVACHGTCQLCTAGQGGILDATLTAGFTAGRVMLYGLAGVAMTTGGYNVANPDGTSIGGAEYDTEGTVYGVGAEYAFNDHWSVGIEYNAYDFGGGSGDATWYDVSSETDIETIQARVIFTF